MTKPAYDTLSLVFSYLFMGLGVAIAICAAAWARRDRSAHRASRAGGDTVGYIRLTGGSGKRVSAKQRFAVPVEGTLGSVKACDVVIPSAEIPSRAARLTLTDAGMLMAPIGQGSIRINGADYRVPVMLDEDSMMQWGSLSFHLDLIEGATALQAAIPSPPLTDGTASMDEPPRPRLFRIIRGSPLDHITPDGASDEDDPDDDTYNQDEPEMYADDNDMSSKGVPADTD